MYDTWGEFALLCEKYLVICNLPKLSKNGPGLKGLIEGTSYFHFTTWATLFLLRHLSLINCINEYNDVGSDQNM